MQKPTSFTMARPLWKDDFRAAAVEKTRTVDIIDFVKTDEIDDRFFETPNYLVPAKGGEHAYALWREATRESKRIGIAKFILRDTQHLAAVEAIRDALVLTIMRFADELVDVKAFSLPRAKDLRKPELDMAKGAREQPGGGMGSGKVHRPVLQKPDANHTGQAERQAGRAGT